MLIMGWNGWMARVLASSLFHRSNHGGKFHEWATRRMFSSLSDHDICVASTMTSYAGKVWVASKMVTNVGKVCVVSKNSMLCWKRFLLPPKMASHVRKACVASKNG